MKPLVRALALVALLATPAQARVLPNIMAALVPYRDNANGFALQYPGGWKISRGDRNVCFFAEGPNAGEAMFVSRPVPTNDDFNKIYTALKGQHGAQVTSLVLDGVQVARGDFQAASGGKPFHARVYQLISKGRLFNITLRCLAKDYPRDAALFDNVQRGLKFPK